MCSLPPSWLRGPLPDVHPALQPVAFALIQVREEIPPLLAALGEEQFWAAAGRSAPIGFHAMHMAGSLERLFTYARGEMLSPAQLEALAAERTLAGRRPPAAEVSARLVAALDAALAELPRVPAEALHAPRAVGRAALPSTTLGALAHAAEHTARHAAQIATLERVVCP